MRSDVSAATLQQRVHHPRVRLAAVHEGTRAFGGRQDGLREGRREQQAIAQHDVVSGEIVLGEQSLEAGREGNAAEGGWVIEVFAAQHFVQAAGELRNAIELDALLGADLAKGALALRGEAVPDACARRGGISDESCAIRGQGSTYNFQPILDVALTEFGGSARHVGQHLVGLPARVRLDPVSGQRRDRREAAIEVRARPTTGGETQGEHERHLRSSKGDAATEAEQDRIDAE